MSIRIKIAEQRENDVIMEISKSNVVEYSHIYEVLEDSIILCAVDGQEKTVGFVEINCNEFDEGSPLYELKIQLKPGTDNISETIDHLLHEAEMYCKKASGDKDVCLCITVTLDEEQKCTCICNNGYIKGSARYFTSSECFDDLPYFEKPRGIYITRIGHSEKDLVQNYKAAYNKYFTKKPLTDLEYDLSRNIFMAISEGNIIGGVTTSLNTKEYGDIDDFFVLPEWKDKGVDRALMIEALSYLYSSGEVLFLLFYNSTNEITRDFLEECGYYVILAEVDYFKDI